MAKKKRRQVVIEIHAFEMTEKDSGALFDRVAKAAHKKDEQVFCFGRLAHKDER